MGSSNNGLTYEFFPEDNKNRLKELILYIADRYTEAPLYGKTKLNKTLFFSDFYWFINEGTAITGVRYMHKNYGGVPVEMNKVLDEMQTNGDICIQKKKFANGKTQYRIIPLRKYELNKYFSAAQISYVDEIIRTLWDRDADETSELSHGKAWNVFCFEEELIPYQAILLSDNGVNESDLIRTKELIKQYAW